MSTLCVTPPSLQVPLPTQDSDRRDKKYPLMVHKVTESDTSYLADQRLGPGLLEYTVGGRAPKVYSRRQKPQPSH